MGFYENRIMPRIVDMGCGTNPISKQREKITPAAAGCVLEIGFGSGRNLPFYDGAKVEKLWGLEPSETMRRLAAKRVEESPINVEFLGLSGEEIPLEKGRRGYGSCHLQPLHDTRRFKSVARDGARLETRRTTSLL